MMPSNDRGAVYESGDVAKINYAVTSSSVVLQSERFS
jgi:hypothetical protein